MRKRFSANDYVTRVETKPDQGQLLPEREQEKKTNIFLDG